MVKSRKTVGKIPFVKDSVVTQTEKALKIKVRLNFGFDKKINLDMWKVAEMWIPKSCVANGMIQGELFINNARALISKTDGAKLLMYGKTVVEMNTISAPMEKKEIVKQLMLNVVMKQRPKKVFAPVDKSYVEPRMSGGILIPF